MKEIKDIKRVKQILLDLNNLHKDEYQDSVYKSLNKYVDSEISYQDITKDSTKEYFTLKEIKEVDNEPKDEKINRLRDEKSESIKMIKKEIGRDDLDDKKIGFPLNEVIEGMLDNEISKAWFLIKTSENRMLFFEE